jgi:hypothetical protein
MWEFGSALPRPTPDVLVTAARRVSSALDRARGCPSVGGQNATSTCPGKQDAQADHSIARPTTDSNHQLAPFRDVHVYAAYSTCPVDDTGSHPRVSMPSHLPGPGPTAPNPSQ